jgi:serine/threonine-protein kinase
MKLLYIPAGDFLIGSSDVDALAQPDEKPQHTVYLNAFWIDQTVVSNAMYTKCVQSEGCKPHTDEAPIIGMFPYYGNPKFDNFPMIDVSWYEAAAYCKWAGRRLPSEAEWEKAARGTDGRIYPWSNKAPNDSLANFNHPLGAPEAVDSNPKGASPYGALDMAGNVWQWVNDPYYSNYYKCTNSFSQALNMGSPSANPQGPNNGGGISRVVRGG